MKQTLFFLGLVLSLFLVSCGGSKSTVRTSSPQKEGISFVKSKSLQPLLDRAKAENKLVFLDFYTTWCLPCRVMDEEVFSLAGTGRALDKNFISYKVNAEKDNGPVLATVYSVYAYPALLFLDADGNVLARKDGSLSNSQFLDLAEVALVQGK